YAIVAVIAHIIALRGLQRDLSHISLNLRKVYREIYLTYSFTVSSDELKENPEARRSLNQIPQNQCRASLSFGHVYFKPVTDKLEEFRKASIAYVVMPLDDNTFQVAAASGNDVWIVQMSDCTICTCGDFQRCTR
uniref:Uncharacterized protein n=1 Tax=Brassica oleracea var. oleracea TaxID=109376 RepID=A0A0D2ZXD9_BRAOL